MTRSSSKGSSSRSNSEYADVADMFRELKDMPGDRRSSSGSATASSSGACRWPITSPGASTAAASPRRPGPGGPRRPGQRGDPVRRQRRLGLRVVRGADHHGRGPQALPGQQLVGQGAPPAQGAASAARRGDRGTVAATRPRAHRLGAGRRAGHGPRRGGRGSGGRQLLQHAVDRQRRQRHRRRPRDRRHAR